MYPNYQKVLLLCGELNLASHFMLSWCQLVLYRSLMNECEWIRQNSGSQSVVRGSKGISDQITGDLWIHFCNGYFAVT
jgi:hypothetical protein